MAGYALKPVCTRFQGPRSVIMARYNPILLLTFYMECNDGWSCPKKAVHDFKGYTVVRCL